jgi:DNA-binding HxlR family transcriptional regulator
VARSEFCPRYHHAVELLGRRWNGAILRAMLAGRARYAEIRGAVPGLSDTLLSQRLDELEREGVVERTVIDDSPVRVEYHLTAKGAALEQAVAAISDWAEEWLPLPPPEQRTSGTDASPHKPPRGSSSRSAPIRG